MNAFVIIMLIIGFALNLLGAALNLFVFTLLLDWGSGVTVILNGVFAILCYDMLKRKWK